MSSMSISQAFGKCYEGIKECTYYTAAKAGSAASAAGSCIISTASAVGSYLSALACRIGAFVKPYLQQMLTFAKQNKQPLMIAGISCAVGAALAALFSRTRPGSTTTK